MSLRFLKDSVRRTSYDQLATTSKHKAPQKDDPNTAAAKILAEVEREKAQMQMQV